MAGLTIGKFAAQADVSVETVRFYQRRGLIALPDRQGSGFREYTEADQWRLAFIRRARQLGFTLAEIRDLLGPAGASSPAGGSGGSSPRVSPAGGSGGLSHRASPAGGSGGLSHRASPAVGSGGSSPRASGARSPDDITKAAEAKLAAVAGQIAELTALQCRLRRLVHVCAHGSRDDCVALHLGDPHLGELSLA